MNRWNILEVDRYTVEDYYGDLMRISSGRADPELAMILAQESYPAMKWLMSMGVKYDVHYNRSLEKNGKRYFNPRITMPTTIVGGHGGLNKQLFSIIENRPDIEVKYETKAVKLLVDEEQLESAA